MLFDLLAKDAVPAATLRARYGALLELVRTLIGVLPNYDGCLEIWPPAYRSYNVMVPNLLNLPFLIWGMGAPRSTIGLTLYAASAAAQCTYCTAHSCSFAMRRGASPEDVVSALDGGRGLSDADRAAVRVARALSVVPTDLRDEDRAAILRHFSPANAEWVVLAIGMMGWLNKTMDALGVPLEESTAAEVNGVIGPGGWRAGAILRGEVRTEPAPTADSLGTRLGILRQVPTALRLDKQWTAGVPDQWPAVGEYLRARTGHSFPILSRLRHKRAIRAIATMIKDTLGDGVLDRADKLAAGAVYASAVGDTALGDELRALGAKEQPDSPILRLARAIAPSPPEVDAGVLESSRALPSAAIIEVVAFVALLQMLHRIGGFYGRA
jgi:hypothetical protein